MLKKIIISLLFYACLMNSVQADDSTSDTPSTGVWQMATGGTLLGLGYGAAAFVNLLGNGLNERATDTYYLFIPIAGPFIDMASGNRGANGIVMDVCLGAAQVIGAGLLTWGIVENVNYHSKLSLTPVVNQRYAGVLLNYTF